MELTATVGIVGGGFWGSAIAVRLADLGIDYTLLDDEASAGASRNAAGICKLSWYKQDTVSKMLAGVFTYPDFATGLDWLRDHVTIRNVPERFINVGRATASVHADNYLADPAELLRLPVRTFATVTSIAPADLYVDVHCTNNDYRFLRVVVAAGAHTDRILIASGLGAPTAVQPLLGRAVLFDADPADDECMTVMTRPYVHYTYRLLNGQIRGGDTVERKQDDRRLTALMDTASAYFTGIRNLSTIGGVRPVCKRMFIDPVAPNVLAATGGHRVGFGLAGAVAHRAIERLNL